MKEALVVGEDVEQVDQHVALDLEVERRLGAQRRIEVHLEQVGLRASTYSRATELSGAGRTLSLCFRPARERVRGRARPEATKYGAMYFGVRVEHDVEAKQLEVV